eukprot:TRINITY_DN65611_c0_g1_i1.p1 TRINITY_DN65611_c0_g1~~TRINITY_DN65611_c0_g1_i1.p1  ORF type:complete len:244 (+),score=98.51 TRINITY_DN65611_c0_g1_i1:75-734(+)
MPAVLEFFFDYSSPWTYLLFSQIEELCRRCGAELQWRPVLVGGIFNTVNPSVYEMRKSMAKPGVRIKMHYMNRDMQEWADAYGIKIRGPYGGTAEKLAVFPVNSAKVLRGAFLAMDKGVMSAYSWAVFRAYWGDGLDISQDDVVRKICASVGMDGDEVLKYAASPEAKRRLRENTDECARRGGFGSPTVFIGKDMYFGNDRLPLIERRLRLAASSTAKL